MGGVWNQKTTNQLRSEPSSDLKPVGPEVASSEAAVETRVAQSSPVEGKPARVAMSERRFGQASRRELLKVLPVLALGAFAIPRVQDSLLKKGLGFQ